VVSMYGSSPQWTQGDRWDRRELHFEYEFNLAQHGLAIMGIERPLDENDEMSALTK